MAKDTQDRLSQLLESYGARPERWPAEDQHLSRHLADADVAAAQARDLDDALDQVAVPAPAETLGVALLGIPSRHARTRILWPGSAAPWQRAAAAVLLLLTGLVAGRIAPLMPRDTADDELSVVVGNLMFGPELPEMEFK